jgi:NitT/TauT family transport system ATP-binding protein
LATVSAPEPEIRFDGVTKVYDEVMCPVDLDIEKGEVVAIVGLSGAGKSTLLLLAAGLLSPTRGTVYLQGEPVTGPSRDAAIVFQDYALFPWRTAAGNISFPLEVARVNRSERRERVAEAIARVGLSGWEARHMHELSGGMRQRVALARAIVTSPAALLLDEPMSALDAITRDALAQEFGELFRRLRQTVLLVTHDVHEAVRLGDRVVVFTGQPGRVTGQVTTDREDETSCEAAVRALLEEGSPAGSRTHSER